MHYDIIIRGGNYFDGIKNPSRLCNIGIANGILTAISEHELEAGTHTQVIDATKKWVMPGFVDIHTHYDIELLIEPALKESVRHGITSVVTGNCSLSAVFCSALDCADMFSRVEALPRGPVLSILEQKKTWDTPQGWVKNLKSLPLGPNISCFLGHSDLRAHVLGLKQAVDKNYRPTQLEIKRMQLLLGEALDEGFLGLSTMTNPWDKLDGDRFASSSLPSSYARWQEYRLLNTITRKAGRVLQSVPNINTKINFILFFLASMPLPWRASLKTSLLSATDLKASSWLASIIGPATRALNALLGSQVMWQALPLPFEIYADGMELVIFEEFGAGRAALHIRDELNRNELLKEQKYRRQFRKDYEKLFSPRIWHRDLYDAYIVGCPDAALIGRSFGVIADENKLHPADLFLDLIVAYGSKIRWKTTLANDRPQVAEKLLSEPNVHIGFADSGAHLRNMGFYNFPLHFLKKVHEAKKAGREFMPLEQAVHKLTRELALWLGINTGRLAIGDRADVVVVDPAGLDDSLSNYHEASFIEMGGINRIVRRNDNAVPATIINGHVAFCNGEFAERLGKKAMGRFLGSN
jgi:N-acyl-D-aspartate/D-glutamate deacylase